MAPKKAKAAARSEASAKTKEAEDQPALQSATNGDVEASAEDGLELEEPVADEPAQQDDAELKNGAESNDIPESKKRKSDESAPDDTAPLTKKENDTSAAPTPKNKKQKLSTSHTPSAPPSRKSSRKNHKKPLPSRLQLLNHLLSPSSADLCRPDDELSALELDPSLTTYTTTLLSPFEELLCAVVLSRPISHRLGLRSIRTLLSTPYSLRTPRAIVDAGPDRVLQALHDARTQHKAKTASQISALAAVVIADFAADPSDTSLEKLRESRDWDTERDALRQSIKGLGKTGLDIFCRRTQWRFEEFFPFVDERTAKGIEKLGLGLPKSAVELFAVLEGCWEGLDTGFVEGEDEREKKRRAFVVICERATGADLEGRTDEVLEAAAAAASS